MKFTWVTFYVSDMEKSLHFYKDLLGLKIVRDFGDENHKIVFLAGDNEAQVELICDKGAVIENVGKGMSVGFGVTQLEEKIADLKAKISAQITGPISPGPNIKFYMVPDPDGYTIQLYENL